MTETNGYATRELLLRAPVRRFKELVVPDLGTVRIRSLTELERSQFEASIRDKNGQVSNSKLVDLKCRLIVLAVVDGEGNQILQNSDIAQLRQQDSKITNSLVDVIQDHIGITDNDLEELEKN